MNRTLFALATAILSVAISPAVAGAIRAQIVSVSCSATTACVAGRNASTGPGVSGKSAAGRGVIGTSRSAYGMFANSRYGAGLRSATGRGSAVVASNGSAGSPTVYALQTGSGSALAGSSFADASSAFPAGVTATSANGVALAAKSTSGIGLSAIAPTFDGIDATSANYYGLVAESASGAGISAFAGPSLYYPNAAAVYADSIAGTALRVESSSGFGIVAESLGTGVQAGTRNGNGVDASGTYIGAIGRAPAQGYPLVASVDGGYPFYVDGAGNIRFTGTIGTFAHTAAGNVLAYGANATTPTVEDAGSATLRSGSARVALDPAFARSIEGMGRYRIFLMPDGDTNGLYVSERDHAGFVVRETRGGRGSIAFDYRVVATTVGHAGERAAFVTERGGPHAPLLPMKAPAGPVRRAR